MSNVPPHILAAVIQRLCPRCWTIMSIRTSKKIPDGRLLYLICRRCNSRKKALVVDAQRVAVASHDTARIIEVEEGE